MQQIILFFYSLCFLLGISSKLLFHPLYILVLALLLGVWRERILSGCALWIGGFLFASYTLTLPSLPEEGISGTGTFVSESIMYGSSPFGKSLLTKGSLETFSTETQTWSKIPCQIYSALNKPQTVGHKLTIRGKLIPKQYPHYVLKMTDAEPLPTLFSFPEWRFQIKDRLRKQFSLLFPHKETASFLFSMVTGEIDDRLMSLQFNRLGLLHLLGVSGFQFSLLALILGSCLKLIFKQRKGMIILIVFLSSYAFLLGNSPPIQRAYITSLLYAIAEIAGWHISPLNALGAALFWVLLLDPCVIFQLGFQFSFLCTAAIFIVYPLFRNYFLPMHSFAELYKWSLLDRVGHTLLFFSKEAIALNVAIHLISCPLLLYHFHKLPMLSLIYNLFLPPAISLAYILLLPGLILYPISSFLAIPFLKLSALITQEVLLVATNPPILFDFQWRMPYLTLGWTILVLLIMIGVFLKVKIQSDSIKEIDELD